MPRAGVAVAVALAAALAASRPARAGDPPGVVVSAQEVTTFQYWGLRTSTDDAVLRAPFTHAYSMHVEEDAPLPRLTFHTDFRGSVDLGSREFRADVLTCWFEAAPAPGSLAVRVGRQMRLDGPAAGFARFDGLSLAISAPRLRVEAWSGVPVPSPLFFTGVSGPDPSAWGDGLVLGVSAALAGHARTAFKAVYAARVDERDLARSDLSLDLSQKIGGFAGVRLRTSFNLLLARADEVVAGVDLRPGERVTASVEYDRFRPSFDSDSVFNVFRQDPYDEVRARVTLLPGSGLAPWVAAGVQVYPEATDAEGEVVDGAGTVVADVAGGVRFTPPGGHRVDLRGRYAGGWTGHKAGLSLSGEARPVGAVSAYGGIDVQSYRWELQPGYDGAYVAATAGAALRPAPWVRVSGDVQFLTPRLLDPDLWVRGELRFLLGWRPGRKGASEQARTWDPALSAAAAGLPWR